MLRIRLPRADDELLIFDDHEWIISNKKRRVWNLRCSYYSINQCPATGILKWGSNGRVFTHGTRSHRIHPFGENMIKEKNLFLKDLKHYCQNTFCSSSFVYRLVSYSYQELSQHIPYKVLNNRMDQWKARIVLKDPKSYSEFYKVINNDGTFLSTHEGDSCVTTKLLNVANNQSTNIMFLTDDKLLEMLSGIKTLYVATIVCTQYHFLGETEKILILSADFKNKVFPIAFAFIKDGRFADYKSVFKYLREIKIVPTIAISNFDERINDALKVVYNGIVIKNSFFSYSSILHYEFERLKISSTPENLEKLRKLKTLALLPCLKISSYFSAMKNFCHKNDAFWPMLEYFDKQWHNQRMKEKMCANCDIRYLVDCQRSSLRLFLNFFEKKPSFWQIFKYVHCSFRKALEDVKALYSIPKKNTHRFPVVHYLLPKQIIKMEWAKFQNNTSLNFFENIAHYLDDLNSYEWQLPNPLDADIDENIDGALENNTGAQRLRNVAGDDEELENGIEPMEVDLGRVNSVRNIPTHVDALENDPDGDNPIRVGRENANLSGSIDSDDNLTENDFSNANLMINGSAEADELVNGADGGARANELVNGADGDARADESVNGADGGANVLNNNNSIINGIDDALENRLDQDNIREIGMNHVDNHAAYVNPEENDFAGVNLLRNRRIIGGNGVEHIPAGANFDRKIGVDNAFDILLNLPQHEDSSVENIDDACLICLLSFPVYQLNPCRHPVCHSCFKILLRRITEGQKEFLACEYCRGLISEYQYWTPN